MVTPKLSGESIGFIVTVLVVLASISASYGVNQHQISKHEDRIHQIEDNVNRNENLLIEIRQDVKWMRLKLDGGL